MAIIDADGLFDGERFDQCSDEARLLWPHLWCASNAFGRIEINYHKIIARAFHKWKVAPTERTVMSCMSEYQTAHLLFAYEVDGVVWGQWDTQKKFLPNYQSNADKRTPEPDAEEFKAWQCEYLESKRIKARRSKVLDLSAKIPKPLPTAIIKDLENPSEISPQDLGNIPERFPHGIGIGNGVGVIGNGIGVSARETPKNFVAIVAESFDRHQKRDKFEVRDSVIRVVAGMDLDFSEMESRSIAYAAFWDRHGWRYNSETFLAWSRNGMPMPPPEEQAQKQQPTAANSPLSTLPKFVEPDWMKA